MCKTTVAQRQTNFMFQLRRSASILMLLLGAVTLLSTAAKAQAVLSEGDAVVTGFSGIKPLDVPVPPGANPLDTFFIDLDGPSMQIVQLGAAEAAPQGQLITAPVPLKVRAGDIGQVFAIALDDATPPNIYLGATSAFGIQIVAPGHDGRPRRIKRGRPIADWMPGQFGSGIGGGPGSIYKVDGGTGAVSLFATIPNNSGPGLGDIVYDRRSRHFYVSDLDTGLVHRLRADGSVIESFDHGVIGRPARGLPPVADAGVAMNIKSRAFHSEDPSTWGYTSDDRLVWGMAIRGGRLYYAVGPQLWSVGLQVDGGFTDDVRWELDVAGMENGSLITDMAFDNEGRLYVAQRGRVRGSYDYSVFAEPKQSAVLRYQRDAAGTWMAEEYAIGMPPGHRNAAGGLALGFGYDANGRIRRGACDAMLWSTGDNLRSSRTQSLQTVSTDLANIADVHGLQGNSRDLVRPHNTPAVTSYFIDYDGEFGDPEKVGHVGDVEIWQPCDDQASLQPLPGGSGLGSPLPASPPSDVCRGDQCSLPQCEPRVDGRCPPLPERTNLSIDKTALSCSKIAGGQRCGFLITVTNTGPGQYNGPIHVQDGIPAGTSAFFSSPLWTCAGGPPVYACATKGTVGLNPGESAAPIPVRVDVPDSLIKSLKCKVKNEVQIVGPLAGSDGNTNPADDKASATANISVELCQDPPQGEKANLKIEKGTRWPICKLNGTGWKCYFQVIVTNTGPGAYNGPIQFKDISSIPNALVTPVQGDFGCGGPPADMTCTTIKPSVTLAPNQAVQEEFFWYVDATDVQPGVCELHNQVKITAAPGGSNQNTDAGDDQSAVTVKFPKLIVGDMVYCAKPPKQEQANLKIEKTVLGDCQYSSMWECYFLVKVTNTGPGVFSGAITIKDKTTWDFSGWGNDANPLWTCQKMGPDVTCEKPPVTLNPGESVQVALTFHQVGLTTCSVPNSVEIVSPSGGNDKNVDPADDKASTTATLPTKTCDNPKTGKTNLTISKEFVSCSRIPGQPATRCLFQVGVTNAGPGQYSGTIVVKEKLQPGTTVSLGWNCVGYPTATCTSANFAGLDPGVTELFPVSVDISDDLARQLDCKLKNEVEIVSAPGGSDMNTDPADDKASATATLPPKICGTPIDPGINPNPVTEPIIKCPAGWQWIGDRCGRRVADPLPPPPPDCRRGLVTSDGHCCPEGTVWTGRNCGKKGDVKQCPQGATGRYPDCKRDITRQCPEGTTQRGDNCVKKDEPKHCPAGTTGRYPDCKCPTGQTGTPPNCKRDVAKHCPPGTTQRGNQCIKQNDPKQLKTEPPRKPTTPLRFNTVPPRTIGIVPPIQRGRR